MASLLDRFFLERPFSSISTDIFLTARHVIEACQKAMAEKLVGIVIKDPDDSGRSRIVPLGATENAPKPYDVAIGCTGKASRCLFRMGNAQALASFCDIATCGYPESALRVNSDEFWVHLRSFKGYIVRCLSGNDYGPDGGQAPGFELSFAIPKGLSGSPLFLRSNSNRLDLVGVCVSNVESETTEFFHEEVDENGGEFRERKVRVEHFGIAHSIESLMAWEPRILLGISLGEIME